MNDSTHEITELLRRVAAGERAAESLLFERVYSDLHEMASMKMALRDSRPGHILQTTALVNEAYLRLKSTADFADVRGRRHFFGIAAKAMERILIEHYRRRKAAKAGGDYQRVPLDDVLAAFEASIGSDVESLHDAIADLWEANALAADVVERRFFLEQTYAEIAADLECSETKIYNTWRFARAWLFCVLKEERTDDGRPERKSV